MNTVKINVSFLAGPALNWAVAKIVFPEPDYEDDDRLVYVHGDDEFHFTPSTEWAQAGPIIEREGIELLCETLGFRWVAVPQKGPE